jgi:hypothetical protein
MGSRDGVFVNDFEVWDDDVHCIGFSVGGWLVVLGGTWLEVETAIAGIADAVVLTICADIG